MGRLGAKQLVVMAVILGAWGGAWGISPTHAAEPADARKLLDQGKYDQVIDACSKAIDSGEADEEWWLLKIRGEMATGKYADAQKTFESGLDRFDASLAMRWAGYDVLLMNNRPEDAAALLGAIRTLAELSPARYQDAASRVALGRAMIRSGVDARQVLEQCYDKAKKAEPEAAGPYIASGELALQKEDYGLAAESFGEAAKRAPENPEVYLGLARAYTDDNEQSTAALKKALELNPNHVPSLLYQADNLLDREAYGQAEALLKKALEINARDPRAWAYRAVLANLTGDHKSEEAYREKALADWKTNPEVDWLIGLKLAHEYRFAEGEAHQRKALEFSPNYLPAKVQLCQDLLRTAKEEEGWKLADEVFKQDPYNVEMYNLVTLHDVIKKFTTVENEHFQLLMDPKEADIYGQRALALASEAREKFSAKYQVSLPDKTVIEIFPAQKDFAIRTFGLPGGEGFLGVCFGPVVTINSPQSRAAHPSNWEAIIWHEFCHSITLYKTHNKMPRWLSEGISVYEEGQRNPSWAEHMNPDYREMVMKGEATAVSKLSSAFMAPPTPLHLMFAYYESSQVVEFVVKRWGAAALNDVLTDLGADVSINEALARHTEPIEKLDADFAAYLKSQAEAYARGADWEEPKLSPDADSAAVAAWNQAHPKNLWGLLRWGKALLDERKWEAAKEPLNKALELAPAYYEGGGAYEMLAAAHRELNETPQERAILEKYVKLDPDALDGRLRLMAIAAEDKDWKLVEAQAQQVLAINPLIAPPYQFLAKAADVLGERQIAIEAHRSLLKLDPLDKAEQHYQISRLLAAEQNLPEARREVLLALEEAPRYRAALDLLLNIANKMDAATQPATQAEATQPPDAAMPIAPAPATMPGSENGMTPAGKEPR